MEELREREGVICTAELGEELEKIEKLDIVHFDIKGNNITVIDK